MAIQFARQAIVARGGGADICLKAAYNKRDEVTSDRTGQTFSFANRDGGEFHEIMLPVGAHEQFKDCSTLWNAVDKFETRKNARLAKELVLALPDDAEITLEDRVELCRRFAQKYFVDKGVVVQFDVHGPHHDEDKNWHAHMLVTTRRFAENGLTFCKHKARDLDGIIKNGLVIEIDRWGEYWRDLQNEYFAEKGLSLRVDEIGIVAQEHLGPKRMRKLMSLVVGRNELNKEANARISVEPDEIIKHLTRENAVFNGEDLHNFLHKHVVGEGVRGDIASRVMEYGSLVPLYHKHTGEEAGWFTTKEVRAQEDRILREAERLNVGAQYVAKPAIVQEIIGERSFSEEQKTAFEFCVAGNGGIKVIQGRAGTGKSYVMQGIREAYERSGKEVIGLGYTGSVADLMQKDGFDTTYTISGLLFRHRYNRINIKPGTVFMVDEAAMVPTDILDELIKVGNTYGSKLILVGDDRQQNARARSGLFSVFGEQFGAVELKTVRRQAIAWQKQLSEALSYGSIETAVHLLNDNKGIHWHEHQQGAISALVEEWCKNTRDYPDTRRLIIAHRNIDVDVINESVHRIRQALNKVRLEEFVCETQQGRVGFSVGDRVQFTAISRDLGLKNGEYGTLVGASKHKFTVEKDDGETISFNPGLYKNLRHGYATTIYKSQGRTLEEVSILYSASLREKPSYVALTRQIKDLKLYVSKEEVVRNDPRVREALSLNVRNPDPNFTIDSCLQNILGVRDEKALRDFYLKNMVEQISRSDEKLSSLHFYTEKQLKTLNILEGDSSLLKLAVRVEDTVKSFLHKHLDKLHQNKEFYHFEEDKVLEPLEDTKENARIRWKQEATESGANGKSPGGLESAKVPDENTLKVINKATSRLEASHVEAELKKDIKGFAMHLLGEPDLKVSTARELIFRKDGKVAVNLEKGIWKDFKNDDGGNLFKLIQRERGGDFKDALAYAASYLGIQKGTPGQITKVEKKVEDRVDPIKQDTEKAAKIKKVQSLYQHSMPVAGTLAERYLRAHRAIHGALPEDLRFSHDVYNTELKKGIPALLAFARNKDDQHTACQVIYLDEQTGNKAPVEITKKTFGVLVGSFVTIQKGLGDVHIAEGVETALSIKEIGLSGTIVASLGVQNIKHFEREAQNIIICADNDGPNAGSRTVIEKSRDKLEKNGYTTRIIEPNRTGEDFNDVLKKEGRTGVARYFGDQSSPQKAIYQPNTTTEQLQAAELVAENTKEASFKLSAPKSLEVLTKQYYSQLEGMYKDNLGTNYKKYTPEINMVAARAAKDALVMGDPKDEGGLRVLFGRQQHEVWRAEELKDKFISKDENFVDNWMKHTFKADSIASIEGKLYADIRNQGNKPTTAELKSIAKQASAEYENNVTKFEAYLKETKDLESKPELAKMYADQRLMFEERYGIKPTPDQLKGIRTAADYGYQQFKGYQTTFMEKIKSKHGSINEDTQNYIDQAARYKAYNELKEITPQVLANEGHKLPSTKELKAIEATVEKSFRGDKQKYEHLHDQQKQAQKTSERQGSRGFER